MSDNIKSIGNYAFYECSDLATIFSEIKTPFEIGSIANTSVTLVVPSGTKAAYQSTVGWSNFTNTVEVGEGGLVGCKFENDGILYTIGENNTASLTSTKSISGTFTILSQVELNGKKYDVTSIGESAFNNCKGLNSITIPNSVTSIGQSAFFGCSGLNSVIIGSGVLSIGSEAFYNTNIKKTIWLTNTPPSGYNNAKGTVNYVSNDQFNIGNKIVYKFLSSNFVVDGIRYVPVSPSDRTCDAIDCIYDKSAENINIGETVTNKGITLTVKKVNPYTCYNNMHIKDLKLGLDGNIGDYAFYCCSNLEAAELGQKVQSIGGSSFCGCSKLKSIVIPDAVTTLGSEAFINCSAMTSAKIGNGIEKIDVSTFSGCSSLTEMNIGSKVKAINKYAFSGCSALPSITIPQAVTTIGNNVFDNCTNLAKVTIADSETTLALGYNYYTYFNSSIGDPIFSSCPLDYVYIGRDISYQTSSNYGYSPFYRNTTLREVKITDKETEITDYEFYGCTNLQNVTIGDGVTTIGQSAFSGCSGQTSVIIPNSVTSIGSNAFSDCSSLNEFKIGSKVKTINQYAFSGCSALPSINIPQAVTTIGDNVFYNCKSLAKVTIADSETTLTLGSNGSSPFFSSCPLDYVYIGRDISYKTSSDYGYSPFYRNTSLCAVKITDKETEISENEFYGCTNLVKVEIGDGVTTIGNWAFSDCSSLKFFAFGAQMATIGKEAFSDCTAIEEIFSKAQTAPACGSQALDDINKWECKLYVPKGYLAVYQAADQWKDFFFMEEEENTPSLKGDVNSDGKIDKDDMRDLVEYIMGNKPNCVT